jgi:PAS domain S-box-containing protein
VSGLSRCLHHGERSANDVMTIAATVKGRSELLAQTLDVLPDGVLLVAGGRVTYANHSACEMFGYDPQVLVGRPIELLVPATARPAHRRARSHYDENPHPRRMGREDLDIEGQRADGTLFPLDVQLTPLPDTTTVVAVVRDMSLARKTSVDSAIDRLDLGAANARNDAMMAWHDLIVQRLFAVAAHLQAQRKNPTFDADVAVREIDDLISTVRRETLGGAHIE